MPSLIMWGKLDQVTPLSGAQWYAAHLPNATSILYEGIGHLPMEEAPKVSAADFEKWLLNSEITTQEPKVTP